MDVHRARPVRTRRSMRPLQRFTIEQANRALPLVRRIVQDIVNEYAHIAELEAQSEQLSGAGRTEQIARIRDDHGGTLERLRELAEELAAVGCELKDGEKGLVDFPAVRDGCDVYLCWRLGEEGVHFWHELDAGFHSRRKIDATFTP
jgi:hypothetical protein